jgi:hypothetical protein
VDMGVDKPRTGRYAVGIDDQIAIVQIRVRD